MRRTALLLTAFSLVAGCSDDLTSSGQSADLATLRRVTAPFQSFDAASSAGWASKITACMSDATLGGMGFHYGNPDLIDGTGKVDEPELLLYEPKADHTVQLVAVEYIIPYTAHARSDAPPVLFGQQYKQNDTFQLWGLHVWAWKSNPSGLYADWNPTVNCDNTTDVASMSR